MITTVSLVIICHCPKISHNYWLYSLHCFIPMTHLFCNWEFVPPNLPHLFLSSPYPPPLGNQLLVSLYVYLCFCLFKLFFFLGSICLSLSDLFHLAYALKIHPCCCKWQDFLLLIGNNILLWVYTTFSLSIHLSMDSDTVSLSWLLWIMPW